jgi:hypothetical protein
MKKGLGRNLFVGIGRSPCSDKVRGSEETNDMEQAKQHCTVAIDRRPPLVFSHTDPHLTATNNDDNGSRLRRSRGVLGAHPRTSA